MPRLRSIDIRPSAFATEDVVEDDVKGYKFFLVVEV
jgi:hypothetical protein